tara:strand:- start:1008 stop:1250 length:243 start_codon:yes stop_codon:yes gene_type:complete
MKDDRPKNEYLIDTLFGDMKKMDSVIKRLQIELNDLRIKTENIPKDMKSMDSVLKNLTREVNDLKNLVPEMRKESKEREE